MYKRQVETFTLAPAGTSSAMSRNIRQDALQGNSQDSMNIALATAVQGHMLKAVSYTHLDVYKRQKKGVVVSGTHGKTTTSALCAHLMREGRRRPCHYVGAEIPVLGTNAHWNRCV